MRYTNTILQDDWIKNWPELCTHVSSCTTTLTATKAPKRAFYGRLKEMCGYSYNHLKRVQVTFFFRANKLGSCTIMEAAGLPVSVFLFCFFFFWMWKTVFNSTSLLIWGRRSAYHYTATFSLRSKCRLSVNTSTQPVSTVHVLCTSITTRTSRKFYYWIHRRKKKRS